MDVLVVPMRLILPRSPGRALAPGPSLLQVIVDIRTPGASRSFRYSSIAPKISFLTFSIVRSSSCLIFDLLADIRRLVRLTCLVETITARDGDRSPARND